MLLLVRVSTKTTESVDATTNEITIPMQYIARLSGLIDGIPKKPAAPNAMAFTLKNAIKALAKPGANHRRKESLTIA